MREAAAAHAAQVRGAAGGAGVSGTARAGWRARDGTDRRDWPLYEVFVRGRRGLNHVHVGSLHATDAEMALRNARDLYTRRNEGVIDLGGASPPTSPRPARTRRTRSSRRPADKVYRHPTFYEIPDNVPQM